jgi:hypothetical protein
MPEPVKSTSTMMSLLKRISLALMNNRRSLLVTMALWLAPLPVFADAKVQSPIAAETHVSQRQVTVGDVVTYSIIIRHQAGIHVLPPNPTAHFEKGFEPVDQGTSETKQVEGQQEETFWFKFRADAVGFYNLPKIPIEFTAPSSDDPLRPIPGTLQAPEAVIEIRSVLFQEGQPSDIKDIKPIIGAGWDWQKYRNWILLVLAAVAAIAGFFWWLGDRNKTAVSSPLPVPNIKPHETAFAELDRLLAKRFLEDGLFQEHYFGLSEIFRRYLGTLLSIPALDWTTEEIGAYVSGHGAMKVEVQQTILALLPATDQVKFAKAPVELQTALNHVGAVRDFIRSTTPEITSKFQVKSPMMA